ncbi:MAG: lactate racemase domain-containing protein [Armatimonadetes bacterium]|nr:lactate racemase domain-containing protein [Armatimonadota bacterium]
MNIEISTTAFDYPQISLPNVWPVRQRVEAPRETDPAGAAGRAAAEILRGPNALPPGSTLALAVGSRGIANIAAMVQAVIDAVRGAGLKVFIVPAMGSHGGATAEGQAEVLASYGVTAESVGAEVRSSMEVRQVGSLDDGYPVYCDVNALSADGVLLINRIKHHTDFTGPIESGLCKMCAIGLGKRKGADSIHWFGADGLRNVMPEVGRRVAKAANVLGGVAVLENQYGQTAEIHALLVADIGRDAESRLLNRARGLAPRLSFPEIDVLVVDYMGKDISGSGMDTHVIGRVRMPSIPETAWDGPNVRMVCTMDVSPASHGNAAGLGLADIVTRRLIEHTDMTATYTNHRTSGEGGAYRGRVPIVMEDGAAAVRAAMGLCGRGGAERTRVARIRDTEHVEVVEICGRLLADAEGRDDIEVLSGPHPFEPDSPLDPAHWLK